MSLVNEMLKDLECRQDGRAVPDGAAFAGLGAVDETLLARSRARRWLITLLVVLLLLLSVALTQRGIPRAQLLTDLLPALAPSPAPRAADSAASASGEIAFAVTRTVASGPTPRVPPGVSPGAVASSRIVPAHAPAGPAVEPRSSNNGAASTGDGLGSPRVVAVVLPEKSVERRDANAERRTRRAPAAEQPVPAAPATRVADAKALPQDTDAFTDVARMAADFAQDEDLALAFAARATSPSIPDVSDDKADEGGSFRKTQASQGVEAGAQMLYHRARAAIDAGDPLRGEALLQEALALDAASVPAREMLVARRIRQGRLREAQVLLARGLQAVPEHAAFAKMYARLLVDQGADDQALRVLDAHAPEPSADPQYHAFRAALLQRTGDHGLAAAVYREVLDVRPEIAVWWMGLGISLEALGRAQAARDAYRRAEQSGRLSGEIQDFVRSRLADLAG